MRYINTDTHEEIEHFALMSLLNASFPRGASPDGYAPIQELPVPELVAGHKLVRLDVYEQDGEWFTGWELVPFDDDDIAHLAATLCSSIDRAADDLRAAVVGDATRAIEYEYASAEAKEFKVAGYPLNAVPRTVAAWAINGRTPQQAADSIIDESNAYMEALYILRETRLAAKEGLRGLIASGQYAQAHALAESTIAAINAGASGIGNN